MACSRHARFAVKGGHAGFTFIELVITVAIVAVLASIAFPLGEVAIKRVKEQELRQALREIRTAIDAYKKATEDGRIKKEINDSGYPHKLEELVEGVENMRDPQKAKIYFLRRLPTDPMSGHPDWPPALTWGKRSYDSPPDRPQEGKDVFDIYSVSTQKGLNGVSYNLW